jgi:hypothetical protein
LAIISLAPCCETKKKRLAGAFGLAFDNINEVPIR